MSFLFEFGNSLETRTVRMKWPSEDYVIPAGTPMSETGIANDGTAIGILAATERVPFSYPDSVAKLVGKKEPKGNYETTFEIIVSGFIDRERAEKSFGGKYSDAAIGAMGIKFVDSENPKGFGGGASSWNDLTDKPFGDEIGYIIPETTVNLEDEDETNNEEFLVDTMLVEGKIYVVNWEGVDYTCKCVAVSEAGITMYLVGNYMPFGGDDTGEPFMIGTAEQAGVKVGIAVPVAEDVNKFTFSVKGEVAIPIPEQYLTNAFPYYIEVTGTGTTENPYVCNETVANLESIYRSGREIMVKTDVGIGYMYLVITYAFSTEFGTMLSFIRRIYSNSYECITLMPQEDGTYLVTDDLPFTS